MKLFSGRRAAAALSVALTAVLAVTAQNSPDPSATQSPSSEGQAGSRPAQTAKPAGKVLFERSLDASGNAVSTTGGETKASSNAVAPAAEDAQREAVAIAGMDLDVRLSTESQQIAVRGLLTVRNAGSTPLKQVPLQISSSLHWERVRVEKQDVPFPVATVDSDTDHTLQLHEAVVQLPEPLAPGASTQLDVLYSGKIETQAPRLISLGAPNDSVGHSDWDEISAGFTALRGFGNVVWYPVASVPVIVNDGARLSGEIGRQKLLAQGSAFRLKLTIEYPHGHAPTLAAVNGYRLKLNVADDKADVDFPGIAMADTGETKLGFESPSLFVTSVPAHAGTHMTLYAGPEDEAPSNSWIAASKTVSPMLERWLGANSRTELTVVDLPNPDDAPWESGPLLAIPVRDGAADQIQSVLAHAMTHAWMSPNPYWLNEGTANFMGLMWDDHQHRRDRALATLESGRGALALAEPSSPGEAQGQPLGRATSPVYYRTKAAYVLWMLRDILGDDALGAALRASNAAAEDAAADFSKPFEAALKTAAPRRDFKWLFADWIHADHGLPDLTVDKAFPNAVQSGNWLVSVTISNAGYAAAEVPVTVRSATNTTTERVLVPARGTVTPRLLVLGKPTEAQVNDGTVPETQATVHVMHLDETADEQGGTGPVH
jgi:hypothetical protein